MLPNPVISCQKGRISVRYRVRVAGWKGGNRPRSVKKRARELSVWSISPPGRPFLCGKNGISLLKEIYFLPQRREFLAAKKFTGVWKAGKNGASRGFFLLIGGFPRAKPDCLFASFFSRLADAGAASIRTAFPGVRQDVAENGLPASILHSPWGREVRVFPPVPVPASVRAILAGSVLTF